MTESSEVLISIVVPTYNRAAYIQKTIKSILSQGNRRFELIVVDDGSTDNTQELVSAFNDQRIRYVRQENAERGAARNHGVRLASGQYITFLDSDDLLKENHLQEAYHCIAESPDIDIFHLGYDVVNEKGEIINSWKKLPNPVNKKLIEGNFLSCLGVFVKREILLKIYFNEDRELSGSEDYELWIRLASRYNIWAFPVSTGCLVNHESRSVLQINPQKFARRILLFKEYLKRDQKVIEVYGAHLNKIFAYMDLYAALHFSISDHKKLGLFSLVRAWGNYPIIIGSFRFWVVVKKLISF